HLPADALLPIGQSVDVGIDTRIWRGRHQARTASGGGIRGGRVFLPETEVVAVRILADREPTATRHRSWLVGLAAELAHPRRSGVDVLHVEVHAQPALRSEEHTSELQSRENLVCRLL